MSIEETKFYVNITTDLLYDERIPIADLVPSFFEKISIFFDGIFDGFKDFFVGSSDPYDDNQWYKTKLDRIAGTWLLTI